MNTDFEATVPLVRRNIDKLGFKVSDVKIILGRHAHPDHMEGDALMKAYTGAQVMAMGRDVLALHAMKPGGKPHPIDRILKDGDKVTLGGVTLTANLTAGHTPGCTTWTLQAEDGGRRYDVLIVGSIHANKRYVLVGKNRKCPSIVEDYRASFARMRKMHVDVFLGAHGPCYGMEAKYANLAAGGPNPFIDPQGF